MGSLAGFPEPPGHSRAGDVVSELSKVTSGTVVEVDCGGRDGRYSAGEGEGEGKGESDEDVSKSEQCY
jgi:hypothetical protein